MNNHVNLNKSNSNHLQFQQHKKLIKTLSHMNSTELAFNLFIATQTEEKLKRDQATLTSEMSEKQTNEIHHQVGQKVREAIESLGGTMPENLSTPEKSTLKIAKEQGRLTRDNKDE